MKLGGCYFDTDNEGDEYEAHFLFGDTDFAYTIQPMKNDIEVVYYFNNEEFYLGSARMDDNLSSQLIQRLYDFSIGDTELMEMVADTISKEILFRYCIKECGV